jgi:hypothetical protein
VLLSIEWLSAAAAVSELEYPSIGVSVPCHLCLLQHHTFFLQALHFKQQ